jgi:hypothetical protein
MSMSHFIENIGDEPLRFLELFKSPRYMDVSLAQRMALTLHELVRAHLNLDPPPSTDWQRTCGRWSERRSAQRDPEYLPRSSLARPFHLLPPSQRPVISVPYLQGDERARIPLPKSAFLDILLEIFAGDANG